MGESFDLPESPQLQEQQGQSYPKLVAIMQRLLAPDGCPWDREQSYESLRKYVLEEACEVNDAIDSGRPEALKDELGDLLLQVVFLGELARRDGKFGPDDVVRAIVEKLVRRHPHIFGDVQVSGSEEVLSNWDKIKLSLPLFKKLFRALYISRGLHTMGQLINAGVPMLDTIAITAEISAVNATNEFSVAAGGV